jgi:FMN phosphatase YigB (HAD superfamily)
MHVLMLDLGGTLLDQPNTPQAHLFPGALAALDELAALSEATPPLRLSLASNFTMANPPTPVKIAALFDQYLEILDQFELRSFFEPVDQFVTLSTHASVFKPERAFFETAFERMGLPASFEKCLFVTEELDHLLAAQSLGFHTLQFGGTDPRVEHFDNWSEMPSRVNAWLGQQP